MKNVERLPHDDYHRFGQWFPVPLGWIHQIGDGEALMLAYLVHKSRHYEKNNGGWFWRTSKKIEEDIGFKEGKQKRIIRKLKGLSLIEIQIRAVRVKGQPERRRWFHVKWERLDEISKDRLFDGSEFRTRRAGGGQEALVNQPVRNDPTSRSEMTHTEPVGNDPYKTLTNKKKAKHTAVLPEGAGGVCPGDPDGVKFSTQQKKNSPSLKWAKKLRRSLKSNGTSPRGRTKDCLRHFEALRDQLHDDEWISEVLDEYCRDPESFHSVYPHRIRCAKDFARWFEEISDGV